MKSSKSEENLRIEHSLNLLPLASRHLLSEVTVLAVNNFIDFQARLALLLDYVASLTKIEGNVASAFNDYLRQSLDKEFASEDDNTTLRSKLIEALAAIGKGVSIDHLRSLHEQSLATVPQSGNFQLQTTLQEIYSLMNNENNRPEFKEGLQHTMRSKDGAVYEGFIKAGKKHGKGRLTFPNGDEYVGDWMQGERHGKGTYIWKSGARYEGDYANNQRHGEGSFRFADGKVYTGKWKDGLRWGFGKLVWENGDVYEGEFYKSNRTGKGVLKW